MRLSAGFSASIGITQPRPFLYAPSIRPSLHRTVTRRSVIPQSFAASFTVMVSLMLAPPSFSDIVYHCGRIKSTIFGIKPRSMSDFVLLRVILPIYDLSLLLLYFCISFVWLNNDNAISARIMVSQKPQYSCAPAGFSSPKFFTHTTSIASPNEKNRYRSLTASS